MVSHPLQDTELCGSNLGLDAFSINLLIVEMLRLGGGIVGLETLKVKVDGIWYYIC